MGNCINRLQYTLNSLGNCNSKFSDDEDDPNDTIDFGRGNVHVITTQKGWEEKISEARRDRKVVIANFSASWCDPCREIVPLYSDLSERYPFLMFLTIDVDKLVELSAALDVRATPTFFFFREDQQLDKLVGAKEQELQRKVTAVVNSLTERPN